MNFEKYIDVPKHLIGLVGINVMFSSICEELFIEMKLRGQVSYILYFILCQHTVEINVLRHFREEIDYII